jgi:hypothetical protein
MKSMFNWARKNDVMENIPNIDAVSKKKIIPKEKQTFTPEQIKILLDIISRMLLSNSKKFYPTVANFVANRNARISSFCHTNCNYTANLLVQ